MVYELPSVQDINDLKLVGFQSRESNGFKANLPKPPPPALIAATTASVTGVGDGVLVGVRLLVDVGSGVLLGG
jgi:hypothetical protein